MLYTPKPCTNTVDSNISINKPDDDYTEMPTAEDYTPIRANGRHGKKSNAVPIKIPNWMLDRIVPDETRDRPQPERIVRPSATVHAVCKLQSWTCLLS